MNVKYGSYAHGEGEVQISVQQSPELNDAGVVKWVRTTYTLAGVLVADDSQSMETKARSLELAYSVDGRDLRLVHTNGSATHLSLLSASCFGGTRVVQRPSFPDMKNAAYVTFLPYTIVVEGNVTDASALATISFEERISRSGGGAIYGHLEPLTGKPIKQLLKRHSVYRVTQSGSAVGFSSYPTVPSPIWVAALIQSPNIEFGSPRRIGSGSNTSYVEYPVSWSYEFEHASQLAGTPNSWG